MVSSKLDELVRIKETYVKVRGELAHRCRSVDEHGDTVAGASLFGERAAHTTVFT